MLLRCALPLLLAALSTAPAAADPTSALTAREATAIETLLDADPAVAAAAKLCPADAFRPEPAGRDGVEEWGFCAEQPADCARRCRAPAGAKYCQALALQLGDHKDMVAPLYTMRLFALACAGGTPSGCTNRAAIIRNTRTDGDPFKDAPDEVKQACQHRSFALACDHADAWGCAMLGQSYAEGEGTAKNTAQARRFFLRACAVGSGRGKPDYPACRFARRLLQDLRKP